MKSPNRGRDGDASRSETNSGMAVYDRLGEASRSVYDVIIDKRYSAQIFLLSDEFTKMNSLNPIPTALSLTMLPGLGCFTSRHFAFSLRRN